MIKLLDENLLSKINYESYSKKICAIDKQINERTGLGAEFLDWETLPCKIKDAELEKIIKIAEKIRKNYDILVVCGIGGSYLGARAVIEALNGLYPSNKPEIVFAGNSFSSDYLHEIIEHVKDKKFAINVVSKSGTTTETSIAFRILKDLLISKVGEKKAKEAIIVTTDKEKGALRKIAEKEGYESFVFPTGIGGRYSVFTPVGLFPMAVAGIDIKEFIEGAKKSEKVCKNPDISANPAYKYAVIRNYMYKHGKSAELIVSYEPRLVSLGEWLKQLFAESEGKNGKGLAPLYATFSTDLHSLGQYIQDGPKFLFETNIIFDRPKNEIKIPHVSDDLDELNYLEGSTLHDVNTKAFLGTMEAHSKTAKVPNLVLSIEKLDAKTLGYLCYFFMKTCAMSAYLLGVNPFDQRGVEVYKKNMFRLLGKKGC